MEAKKGSVTDRYILKEGFTFNIAVSSQFADLLQNLLLLVSLTIGKEHWHDFGERKAHEKKHLVQEKNVLVRHPLWEQHMQ